MRVLTFFLAILTTVVLGVSFAVLNADNVVINLYVGEYNLPLPLLLLITLGIGILMGLLFASIIFFKQKAENYRLRNRVRLVEKEVDNLRSLPLKDTH